MEDGLLQCDERKIGLALRPGPDISYWELQVQEGKRDAVVHQVPRCARTGVALQRRGYDLVASGRGYSPRLIL